MASETNETEFERTREISRDDKEVDTLLASFDQLYGEKKVPMPFVFGCMATNAYTDATDRLQELIKTKYIPQVTTSKR